MVSDWSRLLSQFLSSEGSQVRFLDVGFEASSDGVRAGNGNLTSFPYSQSECLWWSF